MQKILLTCFLALPCLFQKAIIKLKAIKERLRLPCPPIALRCIESLTYLAAGVFHVAQRSVSRGAYLSVAIFHRPQGGIFRAAYLQYRIAWSSLLCLILTLLCCTSPNLSKSAQSPPKPSLHRSAVHVSPHSGDTHRGEETLSDTFTQVDDGAEVSGPANYTTSLTTLDGGPTLRSLVLSEVEASDIRHRTSLVSPVSRPPASTNETASLRASARSDAPQHRTLVLSRVEASVIGHPTSHPSSSSPDAVIWGRVTEYGSRDELRLLVYPEYFFESPKAPGSNLLFLPLKLGNLMEGAYPKSRSFQYNLSTSQEPQWISLSLGESVPFINRYRIDPGDTIQVFLNLESNSLVFAGPAAAKFKLQQDLSRLEEEFQVRIPPVLWTENPDQVLKDSTYAAQYQDAKSSAGPLLSFKARNQEALNELGNRDLYGSEGLLYRSWALINSYKEVLPQEFLDFFKREVELREWRKYLLAINSHLLYAKREKENSAFFSAVVSLAEIQIGNLQSVLAQEVSPYSAEMMDLLEVQSRIKAGITNTSRYLHVPVPDPYWNRKMLVRLFYKSYDLIPEAPQYLNQQLAQLNESSHKDWLQVLLDLKGTGKKVSGFEFFDRSGALRSFEDVAEGELILLEFWITGCKACLAFNENTLTKVKEEFGKHSQIQVITVSADFTEELWKSSLESGKYTQEEFVNLYTGSLNRKHPFLLQYGISSFPNRILLDGKGRIIQASQVPFLADELIPLLKTYLNDLQPKSHSIL